MNNTKQPHQATKNSDEKRPATAMPTTHHHNIDQAISEMDIDTLPPCEIVKLAQAFFRKQQTGAAANNTLESDEKVPAYSGPAPAKRGKRCVTLDDVRKTELFGEKSTLESCTEGVAPSGPVPVKRGKSCVTLDNNKRVQYVTGMEGHECAISSRNDGGNCHDNTSTNESSAPSTLAASFVHPSSTVKAAEMTNYSQPAMNYIHPGFHGTSNTIPNLNLQHHAVPPAGVFFPGQMAAPQNHPTINNAHSVLLARNYGSVPAHNLQQNLVPPVGVFIKNQNQVTALQIHQTQPHHRQTINNAGSVLFPQNGLQPVQNLQNNLVPPVGVLINNQNQMATIQNLIPAHQPVGVLQSGQMAALQNNQEISERCGVAKGGQASSGLIPASGICTASRISKQGAAIQRQGVGPASSMSSINSKMTAAVSHPLDRGASAKIQSVKQKQDSFDIDIKERLSHVSNVKRIYNDVKDIIQLFQTLHEEYEREKGRPSSAKPKHSRGDPKCKAARSIEIPGIGWEMRGISLWTSPSRKIQFKNLLDAIEFEELRIKCGLNEFQAWIEFTNLMDSPGLTRRVVDACQHDHVHGCVHLFVKCRENNNLIAPGADWSRSGENTAFPMWISPSRKIEFQILEDAAVFEGMRKKFGADEIQAWIEFTKLKQARGAKRCVVNASQHDHVYGSRDEFIRRVVTSKLIAS